MKKAPTWRGNPATWRCGVAALLAMAICPAAKADPDLLWKIVHERCVPHQRAAGTPAPCALVDEAHGFAILKDIKGTSQYLLIPTTRVTGVEDPQILASGAPNYFAEAWANRHYTQERLQRRLPRDAFSLAVNSAFGRSQNQLHIHIDCIRADVAAVLQAHQNEIGTGWRPLNPPLAGHPYQVRKITADTLDGVNPFALVAGRDGAGKAMAYQTIVVVGARFKDGTSGFYVLNDEASLTRLDAGSGEELQDHACALAAPG